MFKYNLLPVLSFLLLDFRPHNSYIFKELISCRDTMARVVFLKLDPPNINMLSPPKDLSELTPQRKQVPHVSFSLPIYARKTSPAPQLQPGEGSGATKGPSSGNLRSELPFNHLFTWLPLPPLLECQLHNGSLSAFPLGLPVPARYLCIADVNTHLLNE